MMLTANLHLQLSNPPLKSKQLLLERGLLSFEWGDLLLDAAILRLLEIEMPFHLLLNSDELIR